MAISHTQIVMAHIRMHELEGDYAAGKIIDERISKKTTYQTSDREFHIIVDDIIQQYKIEQKRKEYRDDFASLIGDSD